MKDVTAKAPEHSEILGVELFTFAINAEQK